MKNDCEILVVGAGPSGLTAALFFASRGHQVTIIDQNTARSGQSKAIGVQAGTLELLAATFGHELSQAMVEAGIPAREVCLHLENGREVRAPFAGLPSEYNFLLMLKQSETERLLEERLARHAVAVLREHELVNLRQNEGHVQVEIKTPRGEIQKRTRFVLGCDGAHSTTRHLLGLKFEGGTYQGSHVLADLRVNWPWDHESVHAFFSKAGAAGLFPLKGPELFRLILIPRIRHSSAPANPETNLAFDELLREAKPFLPPSIALSDPVWISRFRVHHRLSPTMQLGRVFLCGDAAHIHSPIGAQGMNTGMHDALDLGWRLSSILHGRGDESSLAEFARERHRVAAQVVRFTDLAYRTALAPENLFSRVARQHVLPALISRPAVRNRMLRAISEINVARKIIPRIGAMTT